ncbi:acylphosphatase [Agrilactobacillus fermenti]|uniref:acylphosphatase n=1 Tax=Agrilactobacillus fermenti TaxID=2586909 RepID=UPI001E46B8AD|nr:acylphosphatase [Agrilactobacillus fermenti]MCD2256685.1 acylphosphatase [Agrilactobacillus fermenti]
MQKALALTVFGRVQGVGFRYTTKMLADEYHLAGTVANKSDGSVYIEVVGPKQAVDQFVAAIKASPTPFSKVQKVIVQSLSPTPDFSKFRVIG